MRIDVANGAVDVDLDAGLDLLRRLTVRGDCQDGRECAGERSPQSAIRNSQ
jgi:hypothetical protein